jgi:hypothetical protein
MRHWSFETGFGYDNLVLREAETPRPGPRDVLLEMRAASLNYRDLVVLRGQHGRRVQPPLIPLSDGVGIVVETGEDVTDLKPRRPRRARLLPELGGRPPARRPRGRAARRPAATACWPPTRLPRARRAACPRPPDRRRGRDAALRRCHRVECDHRRRPGPPRRHRPHPRLRRCRADGDPAGQGGGRPDHRDHLLPDRAEQLARWAPITSSTAPPRPTGRQRRAA